MTEKYAFSALWEGARDVAGEAAAKENARLGDERTRGLDCGFAWLEVRPGNSAFAKWLKANKHGDKGYNGGVHVWYSRLHSVPTQSVSVHEAACRAARDHLAHGLDAMGADGGRTLSVGSRLD